MKTSISKTTAAIINMTNTENVKNCLATLLANVRVDQNVVNEMLLGIYEDPELPKTTVRDGVVRTFEYYNPFEDEVNYSYEKKHIRFFKSEADIEKAKTEKYLGYGRPEADDQYTIEATIVFIEHSWCNRSSWK